MKKFLRKWLPKLGLSLKSDTDWAYEQRDIAAMLAASFAIQSGYHVDFYQDDREDWDDEWRNILQISGLEDKNTDAGQVSWHLGPKTGDVAKTVFMPLHMVEWDGTDLSKDVNVVKMVAL